MRKRKEMYKPKDVKVRSEFQPDLYIKMNECCHTTLEEVDILNRGAFVVLLRGLFSEVAVVLD